MGSSTPEMFRAAVQAVYLKAVEDRLTYILSCGVTADRLRVQHPATDGRVASTIIQIDGENDCEIWIGADSDGLTVNGRSLR